MITCLTIHGMEEHFRNCNASASKTNAQHYQPLRLAIDIIGAKYCRGDDELDVLHLDIQLRYTNVSEQSIILYRGSKLILRQFISRNEKDALDGIHEAELKFTVYPLGVPTIKGGVAPLPASFVILRSGKSYEIRSSTTIIVLRNDEDRIPGAIGSGDHVLQVKVATWTGSKELAERLRKRWQRYGLLWYEPVISQPLPFKVEKRRVVENCP